MSDARFSVENIAEALQDLGSAGASTIAAHIVGRPSTNDERRAVNKVLYGQSAHFQQTVDGLWSLASATRTVPQSPASTGELAPNPVAGRRRDFPNINGFGDARQALVDDLMVDLLGPADANEVLSDRPSAQYLVGILLPSLAPLEPDASEVIEPTAEIAEPVAAPAAVIDAAEDGFPAVGEDEAPPDDPVPSTEAMNQSAIGLSFAVDSATTVVECDVSFGTYAEATDGWQRTPHHATVSVEVAEGRRTYPLDFDCELDVTCRHAGGATSVTAFLVNRRRIGEGRPDDADCVFQPKLTFRVPGGSHEFVARRSPQLGVDPDSEVNRLLYRGSPEFAVGHGCAADWVADDPGGAREISSAIAPIAESPSVTAAIAGLSNVSMAELAVARDAQAVGRLLRPLAEAYRAWIDDRAVEVKRLSPDLAATATVNLDQCRLAGDRIEAGIRLLERDEIALEAFSIANRAMRQQRIHALQAQQFRRTGTRPSEADLDPPAWRPFQLAFFLLNLAGLSDPLHEDRKLVDLLWFPTGGGKTEAYLGLAAYAIVRRRLLARTATTAQGHGGSGVSVLMRYTLRLLTVQQFQRAATLVCALEVIRRNAPARLGVDPISIGLWVGQKTSPNDYKTAKLRLAELKQGKAIPDSNPVHISSCPWCGADVGLDQYSAIDATSQILIHCTNTRCDFFGAADDAVSALPATVVDEDIYARCPSIVIGTVDKFARLPWKASTRSLFGRVDRWCERHGFIGIDDDHPSHNRSGKFPQTAPRATGRLKPPELIIQDELHLITGPLGTLTAIYETAIAFLTSGLGADAATGPKIVASTATIRRADEQVKGLFARGTRRFPPAGLDASDSFFARQIPLSEAAGRRYVGIYAPGKSGKTVLVRVMARLLQTASELRGGVPEDQQKFIDPFWTLVGYFNSLRELGGASRLIDDDIPARLDLLAKRVETKARAIVKPLELTSRIGPEQVPAILLELEKLMTSAGAVDTLLATNMIQVGVDVDRLGLMVVAGQPKTSAEYIQATSRVGRASPGLVITVLNWARPRDTSHYERFRAYHSTLYRHVEGASLTPFSARSRDRALAGVLVAMLRLGRDGWSSNPDAVRYEEKDYVTAAAKQFIRERVASLDPDEATDTADDVRRLQDVWGQMAAAPAGLQYANPFHAPTSSKVLLHAAEEMKDDDEGFRVLSSLRDVEAEADLRLVSRQS